jgi:hypothetical protein
MSIIIDDREHKACTPVLVSPSHFNLSCKLPYGLEVEHVRRAMEDFIDFLGFVNQQLLKKGFPRLESFLMPANFSSIVGEFINISIPKYCPHLAKNQYHNGHPDLIPTGMFPGDAVQYAQEGIEVKGSRHATGWQGHNPESIWLIVFYFESNTSNDRIRGVAPKLFRFRGVYEVYMLSNLKKMTEPFLGAQQPVDGQLPPV